MTHKNNPKRHGMDLSDQSAHQHDHQSWSRRGFLRTIGLAGATSVGISALPLTGLYGFPLASALSQVDGNRKLVLIRLKGGNDGLNTIVPLYAYDQYANARPNLRHQMSDLLMLNDNFAMPNVMQDLESLWAEDQMRIVNSVGYPDHSLSHFTGADIIASGNSNNDENADGWLARYYGLVDPDYRVDPPSVPPAIKIGGPTSILFNDDESVDISANFATPEGLEELASTGRLFDDQTAPNDCYYGDQVIFLRTVANAAYRYSSAIFDAYSAGENGVAYTSSLGEQLRLVARLIKGGLSTQLYLVTLDGFDTHVGQNNTHLDLLTNLSEAVSQFYQDLALTENDEEVLTMTYSEFGRRVSENGVAGTDHGAAMPVMFFGPPLNGSGTHGQNPDLADLDVTGNLKFSTDFHSLYATVLENWFCIDPVDVDSILGGTYNRLPELGLQCSPNSISDPGQVRIGLQSQIVPLGGGRYRISFDMPQSGRVRIALYTIGGQHITDVTDANYAYGPQQADFSLAAYPIEMQTLVYTIQVNGGRPSAKKFVGSSR
ncbi:MAG: DUF1501 domain-containing protein [Bacteroidota bacterium]